MSISIAGYPDNDKMYKKSNLHKRNDSGELDVFEAAKYFSGASEISGYSGSVYSEKVYRDQIREPWRGGRISLDMPAMHMRSTSVASQSAISEKHTKEKKHKQPSSPGGRLASFLNALFNQTSSRKKKSKSSSQSMKDEEESPGGRMRRRRSSISHFRSTSATDHPKSVYSTTSSSGFRTPPPYAYTPTKSYKDVKSFSSDHQKVVALPKYSAAGNAKSSVSSKDELKMTENDHWLEERLKMSSRVQVENHKNVLDGYAGKSKSNRVDEYQSQNNKEFMKFSNNVVDDGADSDSSSDLFELQNYDLGYYPSGLPVYETTRMESIKRGVPISNGAI